MLEIDSLFILEWNVCCWDMSFDHRGSSVSYFVVVVLQFFQMLSASDFHFWDSEGH